jgi:hypothetical protein
MSSSTLLQLVPIDGVNLENVFGKKLTNKPNNVTILAKPDFTQPYAYLTTDSMDAAAHPESCVVVANSDAPNMPGSNICHVPKNDLASIRKRVGETLRAMSYAAQLSAAVGQLHSIARQAKVKQFNELADSTSLVKKLTGIPHGAAGSAVNTIRLQNIPITTQQKLYGLLGVTEADSNAIADIGVQLFQNHNLQTELPQAEYKQSWRIGVVLFYFTDGGAKHHEEVRRKANGNPSYLVISDLDAETIAYGVRAVLSRIDAATRFGLAPTTNQINQQQLLTTIAENAEKLGITAEKMLEAIK